MGLIRIDHQPSRGQLAVFGAIWAVFFGIFGWLSLSGSSSYAVAGAIWMAAVVVPILGAAAPEFLRRVYLAMAYAAFPIGFVLSHLVLALVYYGVITPTGLLMRMLGYDPMRRRFDPQADTYWITREEGTATDQYFRQW